MIPSRHNSRKPGRAQRLLKSFMKGVFRSLWWFSGRRRASGTQAGFVFPTTLLLLLMVTLTATALTYRTFSRSNQAITQRQQQVVYNAATPAIDRAKSKLEFMFRNDNRFPAGVPPSDQLTNLMLPGNAQIPNASVLSLANLGYDGDAVSSGAADPYTLPGEERLQLTIQKDGSPTDTVANAWLFRTEDIDGDGDGEYVIYSIVSDHLGPLEQDEVGITDDSDRNKAEALVTRTGPLATTEATANCKGARSQGGWQVVAAADNASLQKNFQVNAIVVKSSDVNRENPNPVVETLEFQQSRIAASANKWGAWFRYDLELHPGANFNWNGAMHTDGSLMLQGGITPYMVSSFNSCLYSQESSEITLGQFENFQGQAIAAKMALDDYVDDDLDVHVFDGDGVEPEVSNFDPGTDSVTNGANGRPSDVAMNPLALFTEGREAHNDPDQWDRADGWATGDFTQPDSERIYNDDTTRPFVDDFYRADNRWGPKPKYDAKRPGFDVTQQPETIGDPISGDLATSLAGPLDGLDGYWERQSIAKGLRIIVGQRLELGNTSGWNYDPSGVADDANVNGLGDPLYPPKALHAELNMINTGNTDRTDLHTDNAPARVGGNNQYLQRRSLRDNLAAVQGMVVYHYEGPGMADDGTFPAACMALTAHPGTQQSIINSRTFDAYPSVAGPVKADFLHGYGTNGWEFEYPSAFSSASTFESQYENVTETPLKRALKNLAYFAGDPDGGAPSFKPVQDGFVHPFPYMAMWGDFSPLRRIVVEGDGGTTSYDGLSFADQSTLHSAACTLSLLAYNLDKLDDEYTAITAAEWSEDTDSDGASDSGLAQLLVDRVGSVANQIPLASVDRTPIDVWVNNVINAETLTEADADIKRLRLAADYWQVRRDRTFGFASDPGIPFGTAALAGSYDPAAGTYTLAAPIGPFTDASIPYSVKCDPNFFADKSANEAEALALALALCPNENTITTPGQIQNTVKAVKYPSLYYLFPLANHGQKAAASTPPVGVPAIDQPESEEYIDATAGGTLASVATYLPDGTNAVNGTSEVYQIVDPADLAAVPASLSTDWTLPTPTTAAALLTAPDDEPFRVNYKGVGYDVPLLDKAMYDGRELLNIRVLDIDIAKLTSDDAVSDKWLSSDLENQAQGIVYAYREDAVREDEIVRPKNASANSTDCQTIDRSQHPRLFAIERDATCYMQAEPINAVGTTVYGTDYYSSQDPPLTSELISFKPVDFVPDPERRPYGFRLRTGDGSAVDFSNGGREVGMTFVTDNSVYILGNFNMHVRVEVDEDETTTTQLEEFEDIILPDGFTFDEFYGDRTSEELDLDNFANLAVDHWRPVELLSDAVSILSSGFRDGAIADTYIEDEDSNVSSYTNQPRPFHDIDLPITDWIQENPDDATSPVWVDRNGSYYYKQGYDTGASWPSRPFYQRYDTDDEWRDIDEQIGLQPATETYVNATFVSGIVPTRPGQAYGGLHNYTRFLQDWGGGDDKQGLYIQGSFFQLDFSTGSTAPQDQDAWEPGDTPTIGDGTNQEIIRFYRAPQRYFGYDVALLYVPPAPAAARFVTIGSPRSEYYREIAADDPYIEMLKCALDSSGNKVLPSLCP